MRFGAFLAGTVGRRGGGAPPPPPPPPPPPGEFLLNGDASSGTAYWTVVYTTAGASFTVVDGRFRLACPAGGEGIILKQGFTTVVGETYTAEGNLYAGTNPSPFYGFRKEDGTISVGGGSNVVDIGHGDYLVDGTGFHSQSFVAAATTSFIVLRYYTDGPGGTYCEFDNLRVFQ